MFRKSFKVKSNSRLKTTEKKKLRNDLLKDYPNIESIFSLDALSLKGNISVVEIVTSSGETVKVYTASSYPSFIHVNGKYFPTVYIIWEMPSLVYHFTTHSPVIQVIKKGADLMLPGVVLADPVTIESFGSLKKGDAVAINVSENASCFAVGEAAMSNVDMFNSGRRGKCVNVVHFFGDYLCELAPTVLEIPLKKITETSDCNDISDEKESSEDVTKSLQEGLTLSEPLQHLSDSDVLPNANDPKIDLNSDSVDTAGDHPTEESMEDLLQYCFYKSLLTSAKKVPLPLLTNVFYKVHMMNVYPQGSRIDIKKSKYKKLSTFLEAMSESKVIKLEQNTSGVHKITGIDHSHYLVREFAKVNMSENVVEPPKKTSHLAQGPCILEKYSVNASVLPLFSKYSYRKGDTVTQIEIRKVITSYIKDADLQDDSDKRFIKPDRLLKSVVKKEAASLTWEDIMKAITDIMGQTYQVNLPTNKTLSGKGKMPMIEIVVASRAANKKVTLVNNLTFYGVNLNDFSKECQHGVAASTTINSLPHLKSDQVQIQGNQVIFVGKLLLEKYQIPKKYIRGLA